MSFVDPTIGIGVKPVSGGMNGNCTSSQLNPDFIFYEAVFHKDLAAETQEVLTRNQENFFIHREEFIKPGACGLYSVRKLNASYTGPLMEILREGDGKKALVYADEYG